MEIDRISPDNWEVVRDIRLQALLDAPDAYGSTYAHESTFDETRWRERCSSPHFVAIHDGEPVGLVAGMTLTNPETRDLVSMWVRPDFRGTGLAADLVRAVIAWAVDEKAQALVLRVNDGNDRAWRLYEKLGFINTGDRRPCGDLAVFDSTEMRLWLM